MHPGDKPTLLAAFFLFLLTSCSQAQVSTPITTAPFTTLSTAILLTPTPAEAATETAMPTEVDATALPIEVEEIKFQSAQFSVTGSLQIPPGEGAHPTVIMVHGDGGIDRTGYGTYIPLMERFLRAGYAVFSYDKPGTGESSGEFSHGADLLSERASILVAAVDLLKEHSAIDPERIGTWGISQAGYVMPLALTKTDDITFMIVTGGPGMNSLDQMVYLIGQQFLCQGYLEKEAKKVEENFAKLFYADTYQEYREAKEYLVRFPYALNFTGVEITPEEQWSLETYSQMVYFNPIEVIQQTTIPVLALFGEKDTQVDPFQGAAAYEEALETADNQNYRVETYPDADHNIVLARTGCMEERDNRSMEDWLNYAPGYLDLMEEWLVDLETAMSTSIPSASPTPTRPPLDKIGGGMIAFVSDRDGDNEIYLLELPGTDGGKRKEYQLTDNDYDDSVPNWSADGKKIAFTSDRDGNVEIYVMEVDNLLQGIESYEPRRLTHHEGEDLLPAWSPDGTQIAFSSNREGNWDIYVMGLDGTNVSRLTDNPEKEMKPTWSPDGTQISYDSGGITVRDIYIMDADGTKQRLVTQADGGWPAWSPDGTQIAYFGRLDGNPEIYIVNVDGTNLRRMTDNQSDDWEPSWSPDGEWLLFTSGQRTDIFVMRADGSETYRLTHDSYSNWVPVWRP